MINEKKKIKIEAELARWKRKYPQKTIPRGLKRKAKEQWINEAYLVREGKKLIISGGGKILLFLLATTANSNMKTYISDIEKRGYENQYLEVLKFQERAKMLGVVPRRLIPKRSGALIDE